MNDKKYEINFDVDSQTPLSCGNSCLGPKQEEIVRTKNTHGQSRASYRTDTKDKHANNKYQNSIKSSELRIEMMKEPTNHDSLSSALNNESLTSGKNKIIAKNVP
mgnify:CR=1 FL=1